MDRVDYESTVVQELLNAHERNELDISPWYQRRTVWTNAHKSYLVNSIFEGMPVPTIYIRHTLDLENELTVKEVVDGQQRVRSLIEFKQGIFTARHADHSKRVTYNDLTSSQRHDFLMSKLSVGYLIGADDSDVIEIFGRLNAVSKTLNAQEKRAAQYSGEFHQFCLREAAGRLPIWRGSNIFTATSITRMAEVQFTAELAIDLLEGMSDYSTRKIDAAYKRWDEEFPKSSEVDDRFERVYRAIGGLRPGLIKDTIFSRSPLFYTLILILDGMSRLPSPKAIEAALVDIDARFTYARESDDVPNEDREFVEACTASTQRIRSRTVRFNYIRSYF
ncbi:DUF262 domain-containing protein [Mycobacterium paraense]|uniref:DUF262 domain-containing protein n=1 Tax=Mycobacterium paraense TaxID=767916 RepID=UPI000A14CC3C|nr:DUF262 domain-containing protein [Mycobacterium paraense]MCV7440815.1 DUF262 domain-containing protein [Mycobacterium paraense]